MASIATLALKSGEWFLRGLLLMVILHSRASGPGCCRRASTYPAVQNSGATSHIVGEAKTPDALRNASDQFFEWLPPEPVAEPDAAKAKPATAPKAPVKRRPKALINAVALLAADTPDGRVGLGALGQYLKRTDPGFSPKAFGHPALSDMVRTYTDLVLTFEDGSGFWVSQKPKTEASES